ncbi:unnamed protein product [Staurois parvus]|uniref:Uncharacterized protein n=1 Tax=Staurois parvus TaxID=386267 RepID=A0ABN9DFP0_9NEOB|nr:unnamed protein product [Staurois parvus]
MEIISPLMYYTWRSYPPLCILYGDHIPPYVLYMEIISPLCHLIRIDVQSRGGLTIWKPGPARGPGVCKGPHEMPWYLFHRLF